MRCVELYYVALHWVVCYGACGRRGAKKSQMGKRNSLQHTIAALSARVTGVGVCGRAEVAAASVSVHSVIVRVPSQRPRGL